MSTLEYRVTNLESLVAALQIIVNNAASANMVKQANLVLESSLTDLTTALDALTVRVANLENA